MLQRPYRFRVPWESGPALLAMAPASWTGRRGCGLASSSPSISGSCLEPGALRGSWCASRWLRPRWLCLRHSGDGRRPGCKPSGRGGPHAARRAADCPPLREKRAPLLLGGRRQVGAVGWAQADTVRGRPSLWRASRGPRPTQKGSFFLGTQALGPFRDTGRRDSAEMPSWAPRNFSC